MLWKVQVSSPGGCNSITDWVAYNKRTYFPQFGRLGSQGQGLAESVSGEFLLPGSAVTVLSLCPRMTAGQGGSLGVSFLHKVATPISKSSIFMT